MTDAYQRLYLAARKLPWDPQAVDLSRERADWDRIRRVYPAEDYAGQILQLITFFYDGEESVTYTLTPYLSAAARLGLGADLQLFLTSQLAEEARHYEFFRRYFAEVLPDADPQVPLPAEPRAVLVDGLQEVANRLRKEDEPARLRELLVEGVAHYMGVVESMLARTGYRGVGEVLASRGWLPGLQEGFLLIRRDGGRHVAFGIHFLRDHASAVPRLRTVALATFDRWLPGALATVQLFDFPQPLFPIEMLVQYAMTAGQQFLAAAGLTEEVLDTSELERDLAEL
jgi:ribonucleoside-diphosphate reductase beta chain